MRTIAIVVGSMLACAGAIAACVGTTSSDGPTGRSSAALTAAPNYSVTGGNYRHHETAVTSAQYLDVFGNFVNNWVVIFNNCNNAATCNKDKVFGWAYSTDYTGAIWSPHLQATGKQFGSPPERKAADGNAFVGLLGDPAVTAIYDPNSNHNGRRVLATNIGNSQAAEATDVVVLLSDDGGHTWGNPHYVNTKTTGIQVDNPVMASHSVSPYGTYVAWSKLNGSQNHRSS